MTTFEYYDISDPQQLGFLKKVTNALGQATSYEGYDTMGNFGCITDANGVTMEVAYDPMGRVTSQRIVGGSPPDDIVHLFTNDYDQPPWIREDVRKGRSSPSSQGDCARADQHLSLQPV
jgi:YD repeat-containing protein